MASFTTLHQMVAAHARHTPDATAITGPGAIPLSYHGLDKLVERTVARLNALGIGRGDRVALVLPNCPEMATAFVAIASAATCAPLNTAYRAEEFEFYLTDLKAAAIVLAAGSESPARAVAERLGVAVLELTAQPE